MRSAERAGEAGGAVQHEVRRQREEQSVLAAQRLALGAVDHYSFDTAVGEVGQLAGNWEGCAAAALETDRLAQLLIVGSGQVGWGAVGPEVVLAVQPATFDAGQEAGVADHTCCQQRLHRALTRVGAV
ncbi:hypothetical protein GCM10009534_32400 [Kribbella sandramycini]